MAGMQGTKHHYLGYLRQTVGNFDAHRGNFDAGSSKYEPGAGIETAHIVIIIDDYLFSCRRIVGIELALYMGKD